MPHRLRPSWWLEHRRLITDVVMIVGIFLVLGGIVDGRLSQHEQAKQTHALAVRTARLAGDLRRGLCELRADRVRGVREGKAFLAAHPKGVTDFTRADIERGIHQQAQTVTALAWAHCPRVP